MYTRSVSHDNRNDARKIAGETNTTNLIILYKNDGL